MIKLTHLLCSLCCAEEKKIEKIVECSVNSSFCVAPRNRKTTKIQKAKCEKGKSANAKTYNLCQRKNFSRKRI